MPQTLGHNDLKNMCLAACSWKSGKEGKNHLKGARLSHSESCYCRARKTGSRWSKGGLAELFWFRLSYLVDYVIIFLWHPYPIGREIFTRVLLCIVKESEPSNQWKLLLRPGRGCSHLVFLYGRKRNPLLLLPLAHSDRAIPVSRCNNYLNSLGCLKASV